MEGDRITVNSMVTEINNDYEYEVKIGEKPIFMFEEDFNLQLIQCAINSVRCVCQKLSQDEDQQKRIAKMIGKKAFE